MDDEYTLATLDKIVDKLNKDGQNKGNTSWVAGLVAFFTTALVVGFLAYKVFKAGRRRTKILHEAEAKQEELNQKEIDTKLELSEEKKAAIGKSITKLEGEILKLQQDSAEIEKQRVKLLKSIDSITSWDDVDHVIK